MIAQSLTATAKHIDGREIAGSLPEERQGWHPWCRASLQFPAVAPAAVILPQKRARRQRDAAGTPKAAKAWRMMPQSITAAWQTIAILGDRDRDRDHDRDRGPREAACACSVTLAISLPRDASQFTAHDHGSNQVLTHRLQDGADISNSTTGSLMCDGGDALCREDAF
jgi:hypothetical protein